MVQVGKEVNKERRGGAEEVVSGVSGSVAQWFFYPFMYVYCSLEGVG